MLRVEAIQRQERFDSSPEVMKLNKAVRLHAGFGFLGEFSASNPFVAEFPGRIRD